MSFLNPTSAEEAVSAFGDGAGITVLEGGTMTIGAMTPVAALVDGAPEPLATFARNVADYEIRGQATLGGNLCAVPGGTTPVGDLQAPLLALGARVRSAGAGGERTDSID